MNPARAHAGFTLEEALAGAYSASDRDPEDVKFSLWRTLDGETTMTGDDGQLAMWRQERRNDVNEWRDAGEIAFGAMATTAFQECAKRVRAKNG